MNMWCTDRFIHVLIQPRRPIRALSLTVVPWALLELKSGGLVLAGVFNLPTGIRDPQTRCVADRGPYFPLVSIKRSDTR